nr:ribosomal rna-processing protein 1 like [Quercus suber]
MPSATMAPSAASATSPNNPFIKNLASSSKATRDAALLSLRTFLSRPAPFSPLDNLKLWKGLFYCMWMSDKPLNQQRLARDLAALVDALRTPDARLAFIAAFWETMCNMWLEIDALRMDKFLYLLRCYVGKGFELCMGEGEEFTQRYLELLERAPLEPKDHRIPNGVRFHVLDVYLDELEKVDSRRTADVEKFLEPVGKLRSETLTKAVRERCVEALEDERVRDWKGEAKQKHASTHDGADGDQDEDEEAEFGGFDD